MDCTCARCPDLHYEKLKPRDLDLIGSSAPSPTASKTSRRLSKDKLRLTVAPSLTLAAIPPEVYEYRPDKRSALEWVID